MRRGVLVLLTVMTLFVRPCAAIETDKAAHFGLSHMVTTATYGICKAMGIEDRGFNLFMAVSVASIVGLSKEFSDRKFDKNDLLYDGLGIGSSVLFVYTFNF